MKRTKIFYFLLGALCGLWLGYAMAGNAQIYRWELIEEKKIDVATSTVSFDNIPYSKAYKLTGHYPNLTGATTGLAYRFNQDTAISQSYNWRNNTMSSAGSYTLTTGNGSATIHACRTSPNGTAGSFEFIILNNNETIYGSSTGRTVNDYINGTNTQWIDHICTYNNVPISSIQLFQESGITIKSSSTFELWGSIDETDNISIINNVESSGESSSDNTGIYIIYGIWTFFFVFFGLIFYHRTRVKSL